MPSQPSTWRPTTPTSSRLLLWRASARRARRPKLAALVLGEVEVLGVERWELWGVMLRCRMKVLPHERDNVRREFTRRLVIEFQQRGLKTA